jgi:hypothetical protein
MSDRRSLWIPWAIGALACLMLTAPVVLSLVAGGSNPGLVAGSPARLAGTSLTPNASARVLELRVLRRLPDEIVVEARLRRADGTPEPAEELEACSTAPPMRATTGPSPSHRSRTVLAGDHPAPRCRRLGVGGAGAQPRRRRQRHAAAVVEACAHDVPPLAPAGDIGARRRRAGRLFLVGPLGPV